jgi:hypothetical protein
MSDPVDLPSTCEICGGPMTREIVGRRPDPNDPTVDAQHGYYERAACQRCNHIVEPETPQAR